MTNMMEYAPSHLSPSGARKYYNKIAEGYDAKRQSSPKWTAENEIIERFLEDVPDGAEIMDVPTGTGRFFDLFGKRDFNVKALDASMHMLRLAEKKIPAGKEDNFLLGQFNVCSLPFEDKSVDVAMMIRLTRWLNPGERVRALGQLQRIARDRIIFTARVANHQHMYSYQDIERALDGWEIVQNEPAAEDDYRVIMLKPV